MEQANHLENKGKYEEALKICRELVKSQSHNPEYLFCLGSLLDKLDTFQQEFTRGE